MGIGRLSGGISNTLVNIGVNTREWFSGLDKAQKRWVKFGAALQVTGFRMMTVWGATFGAAGALVAKFGASFEKEFTGVKKTVQGTPEQFDRLKQSLLDTAKATGMSADQLAVLTRKAGQLGIETENLSNFTNVLAKLSIAAADLDPEEAATALARLMKITGTPTSDVEKLATTLAFLGDRFATTEDRILNFSQRISGLGAVTGMTAVDILGLGAAFTATVPGVELVATQVSKSMQIFVTAVAEGGEELQTLNKIAGIDFRKAFEEDAAGAMSTFLEGLGELSKGDAIRALKDLHLTNQRAAQAFLAAAKNSGEFTRALADARAEAERTGTAQSKLNMVFKEQMDTVFAKFGQLKESLRELAIVIFTEFSDSLKWFLDTGKDLVEWTTEVAKGLSNVPTWLKTVGIAIIALGGIVAAFVTTLGMLVSAIAPFAGMFAKAKIAMVAFSGATQAATAGPVTAWSIKAAAAGKSTASWGSIILGTGTKLAKFGGQLALVGAAFFVGYQAGKGWLMLFPSLGKAMDKLVVSMSRFLGIEKEEVDVAEDLERGRQQAIGQILRLSTTTGQYADKTELLAKSNNEINEILAKQLSAVRGVETGIENGARSVEEMAAAQEAAADAAEKHSKALKGLAEMASNVADAWAPAQTFSGRKESFMKQQQDMLVKDANAYMGVLFKAPQMPDMFTGMGQDRPGSLFQESFQGLPDHTAEIAGMMSETSDDAIKAAEAMKGFRKHLADANRIGNIFGGTIGEVFSQIIASTSAVASVVEGGGFGKIFSTANKEAGGGVLGAITGGLAVAGPIAAIASTAIGIFTKVFAKDPRWKVIGEETAAIFGKSFSEELSKKIEASEKGGLDFGQALAANIGDIIEEVGVTAENFSQMWGHFFLGIDSGVASVEQLSKAFVGLKDHLQGLGTPEANLQIGEMTRRLLMAGEASAELTAHISEQSQALIESLTPALEWISNLTDMTIEDATALQGVIVAAWGAAVAETGSFIQAVGMLGDTFVDALARINEVLGPNGENLLGPITEIINVVKNSGGALEALAGISDGLDAMAQMGILTGESLSAMGEAIRVAFEKAVSATGNETAALKASWPELVKLYDYYEKLGLDVPGWLQEMIDKGQEMGLSMSIPLGTEEALNRIVDILGQIAAKLGAVATKAGEAGEAIGGIPNPGAGGGGNGRPDNINAQVGFQGDLLRPTTIRVAESGPEHVSITPSGGGSSGGGMGNVTLLVDGVVLGKIISEGSKTGKVRIMPTAVREF